MTGNRRAATLPVRFFARPADVVAPALLGAVIESRAGGVITRGRIVETEAYLGHDDPAAHGYLGRKNERNAAIFGPPGSWYVYLSYGMHWCANLVCAREGEAAAVLVRALEPLDGLDIMRERRNGVVDRHLCSGPGKLCQALGITRELDATMMAASPVTVSRGTRLPPGSVAAGPRIGITRAADWALRFVIAASPWVSRKA
ncbi:MAG: DNA-3-methyladenine glycosylase [Gemmatimonadales bacterium]|nr:DNA-3-methyladenine glycosylase [Gemmatimonadales bacterium]